MKNLILITALFAVQLVRGQNAQTDLLLEVDVRNSFGRNLPESYVIIYGADSGRIDSFMSTGGRFTNHLGFETVYTIVYTADGFERKGLQVDTRGIPASRRKFGYELAGIHIEINPGRSEYLPAPSGYVFYDKKQGYFEASPSPKPQE